MCVLLGSLACEAGDTRCDLAGLGFVCQVLSFEAGDRRRSLAGLQLRLSDAGC